MRVGTLYAVLRLETGAFDAALAKSEGKLAAFFGLLQAAAVLAASALAVVVGGAIYAAASFEKHLVNATAIMGDLSEDLKERLSDAARQIAKETTFSANQAADAYYYLASAGYTAEQAIALLPVVARFAQASLVDMAAATSLLSDTQTVFGMRSDDFVKNAENMARVSDVLTAAAIESNATMDELAKALTTKAGASFRLVGKDIEEATAVLMVFANQGVKGAMAGTALSIVLRELQTKAIKNADAFAEFGIAVFDANGEMRNMADIIYDFEQALVGMSDEEKKATLIQLGLTDRSNAFILSLIGMSGQIREYEALLREAGGTTQTVAEKQLDNLISQLTITWHKITDVAITIGKKLIPGLTEAVKWFGNWIDSNNELAGQITDNVLEAIRKFILFLENRVFPILKRIWGIIGDVAHQLHMWIVRLGDLTGAFGPVDKLLSAFVMGVYDLLAALENNIIPLSILSIAGALKILGAVIMGHPLVALLTVILMAVGLLHQAWNTNVGGIQEKWAEFVHWFETDGMPVIQDAIAWFEENVGPALSAAFQWFLEEAVPALITGLKWLFEEGFPALGRAISEFYEANRPALERIFTWLTDEAIPDVIEGFKGFIDWLIENGPTILSLMGQLVGFGAQLLSVWLTIASYVIPVLWNGLMLLLEPLGTLGEAFGVLLTVVDLTMKEIGRIVARVVAFITEVIALFETVWNATWTEIQSRVDIFVGAFEEAKIAIGNLIDELAAWVDTAGGIIEGVINDISNAIYTVIAAIQKAIDIINTFIGAKDKVSTLTGSVPIYYKPQTQPPPAPYQPPPSGGTGGTGAGYKPPMQFATGVTNFAGGFAIVGERGPELLRLPPHTSVEPNLDSLGHGSDGVTINLGGITLHTGNDVTPGAARRFAEMIHDELAATMQEQGARFTNKPRVGLA